MFIYYLFMLLLFCGMAGSLLTSKPAQDLTIPQHATRKTCRAIKNISVPAQQQQLQCKQHCSTYTYRKSNMIALTIMLEIPQAGISCSLLTSKPAQNLTIPKHTTKEAYRTIKNIPASAQKLQNKHYGICNHGYG